MARGRITSSSKGRIASSSEKERVKSVIERYEKLYENISDPLEHYLSHYEDTPNPLTDANRMREFQSFIRSLNPDKEE